MVGPGWALPRVFAVCQVCTWGALTVRVCPTQGVHVLSGHTFAKVDGALNRCVVPLLLLE